MDGYAPLSYTTVESWARLTGKYPTPDEVEALMEIDRAIREPAEIKGE